MRQRSWVVLSSSGDPGHAMIQLGVKRLIEENCPGPNKVTVIDKHSALHCRGANLIRRKLLAADAIVLAVGPIAWPYVERAGWVVPVTRAVDEAAAKGTPVCALALGSCYGLARGDDDAISSVQQHLRTEELDLLSRILRHCSLITVRDRLMSHIVQSAGLPAALLPCVATLAFEHVQRQAASDDDTVLVNYMRGAGHHDYLNVVDPREWHRISFQTVQRLGRKYQIRMLCHATGELELAPLLAPYYPAHIVSNPSDLIKLADRALAALASRIHASLGLAALGVPSLTVGSDSRLLSLREVSLPTKLVTAVTVDELVELTEQLAQNRDGMRNRIATKITDGKQEYIRLFGRWLQQEIL